MERNIFEKQRDLNDRLNRYRDEYYKGFEIITVSKPFLLP